MNYKNPIIKPKKKNGEEIDISDLDAEAKSKILNINQEAYEDHDKASNIVIKEAFDIEEGGTNKWTCVWVESRQNRRNKMAPSIYETVEDMVKSPAGKEFFLRGAFTGWTEGNNAYVQYEQGYLTKLVYWHENSTLYTEKFSSTPNGLRPVTHSGLMRKCINFTSKTDSRSVPPFTSSTTYDSLFRGWYNLSLFDTDEFVGVVPGERVLQYIDWIVPDEDKIAERCEEMGITVEELLQTLDCSEIPEIIDPKFDEMAAILDIDINNLVTEAPPPQYYNRRLEEWVDMIPTGDALLWFSSIDFPTGWKPSSTDSEETLAEKRIKYDQYISDMVSKDYTTEYLVFEGFLSYWGAREEMVAFSGSQDFGTAYHDYDRNLDVSYLRLFIELPNLFDGERNQTIATSPQVRFTKWGHVVDISVWMHIGQREVDEYKFVTIPFKAIIGFEG